MRVPPPTIEITSDEQYRAVMRAIVELKSRRRSDVDQAVLEGFLRAVELWRASRGLPRLMTGTG
jgi:hypothetical protein